MQLCAYNHPQICHEGDRCPCCDLVEETSSMIVKLESRIEDLEDEVSGLREHRRAAF